MNNAITIGVDPGMHGALAFLDGDGQLVAVHDYPVSSDGALAWIDGADLYALIGAQLAAMPKAPVTAWVERVGAMPMQGRTGIFTFGLATGSVLAVLQMHNVAIEFVTPVKWKGHFGLIRKPKDASLAKARLLYPQAPWFTNKGHVDRAEAALIARYGRRRANERVLEKTPEREVVDIAGL